MQDFDDFIIGPQSDERDTDMETIDLTMTWEGALPLILAVLTDGNAEGRKFAREELMRMAQVADRATSDTNGASQNPGGYAHCTKHDEWYDTEHWSCCEKCWENIKLQRLAESAQRRYCARNICKYCAVL